MNRHLRDSEVIGPLTLRMELEQWPLVAPFRIAGHDFEVLQVLHLRLAAGRYVGHAEAAGVYYKNDKPESIKESIEKLRTTIETGLSCDSVQRLLPPGGARNAIDCALWDLCAKLSGVPAWQLAGLERPRPLLTTFGCGADTPEKMAACAVAYRWARAIKLKLTGEPSDPDRVRAVREALPDVWLGVDANQGFTRPFLERLMPVLIEMRVSLIEQPFPVGHEALLDGLRSPIQIAADESVQGLADIDALAGRFNVVNIKLDKCGGLTEALAMARASRDLGLDLMVGNMIGTSLAMAPASLVGQLCAIVDLDGPVFLTADRPTPMQYSNGFLTSPEALWGFPDLGAIR